MESNTEKFNTSIRDLTKEELLIVAGGYSTGIVCEYPLPYEPDWDFWDYYDDPNYEDVYTGGGGGGGGSTSDPEPEPEPEPEEPADPDADTPTNPPEPDPLPGNEDPNPNPNYHLP
ncbi:hypothetical protein [Qipengyuania aquimaris]|uniref:hypothetical protein n=1 Tax=Qipengyuania aquimaris TaxID=255984 RepID=UPI001CD49B86|nr:hypothetical protein [Qipengyuania aquimaris]MCA0903898.1 hypothetical protein [Qipengyuania aquimaris]